MLSMTLNSAFLALAVMFQTDGDQPVIILPPPAPRPYYVMEIPDDPEPGLRENWYPPVAGPRYNGTVPSWKNPTTFSYVPPALKINKHRVLIFNPYASDQAHRNVAECFVLP